MRKITETLTCVVPLEQEDWVLCRVFCKSRGIITSNSNPSMEITSSVATNSSVPLPSSYMNTIKFDIEEEDWQIACFSGLPSSSVSLQDTRLLQTGAEGSNVCVGRMPDSNCCDEELVKKAVLVSHFPKLEGKTEQDHLESFLQQDGWSHVLSTF